MKKDPTKETLEVYEKTAKHFSKIHPKRTDETMLGILADFVVNLRGKKVLDIGCGSGRDSKYFLEKGLKVTGIDYSRTFINIASKKVPNAKFLQMDMRKLEFPGNSFDGVWAEASFLHIPKNQARKTLIGIKRILKKDGLLHISVKKGEGEKFVKKDEYIGMAKFFSFYSPDEFRKLIESCGFNIIELIETKKDDTNWIHILARK